MRTTDLTETQQNIARQKINKQDFENIFIECMEAKQYWRGSFEEGANYYMDVEPHMTIRDFEDRDIETCDKDFTDVEHAWEYLQTLSKYRIIDATGTIHADVM